MRMVTDSESLTSLETTETTIMTNTYTAEKGTKEITASNLKSHIHTI